MNANTGRELRSPGSLGRYSLAVDLGDSDFCTHHNDFSVTYDIADGTYSARLVVVTDFLHEDGTL